MSASTIIATPTDPNANSYATLAEANVYFGDRLAASDWTDANTNDKNISLLEATRRIDRFRYFDEKYRTSPEQRLQLPRSTALSSGGNVGTVGSATSIVVPAFANQPGYPDNYFKGWAIEMTSGTYKYKISTITAFVAATGTFTIDTFGGSLGVGDGFILIEKVPDIIKYALYETAIWLLGGGEQEDDIDPMVKSHSIGKFSETFVDGAGAEIRLPRKAYAYLQKYISRIGVIS